MLRILAPLTKPGQRRVFGDEIIERSVRELCFVDHGGDEDTIRAWVRDAQKTLNEADYAIGVRDDHLLLGVGAIENTGQIVINYVAPEGVGYGIGAVMIEHLEHYARGFGVGWLTVVSTAAARHFYRKHGYTEFSPPESGNGVSWNHQMGKKMPACTMCDGTGLKDYAGFGMDPCDHRT